MDVITPPCPSFNVEVNTLRPRQNGRLFADDTFKRIFLNENIRISIEISLKFVPKGSINNNPALVLIMAWRWPGDKPLSEPMLVRSLTHICVTRPQWLNWTVSYSEYITVEVWAWMSDNIPQKGGSGLLANSANFILHMTAYSTFHTSII